MASATQFEESPVSGRRAVLAVAFCCLAAIGEGFDLQAPGVTLPVLGPLFKLSTGEGAGPVAAFFSEKSLFLSMSTFGLLLGALLGGRLSDRFGRKWVAIASIVLFSLLSALTARATSTEMLLGCRFLTGIGLGGALPNLIAIVAEHVSAERRSTAVGCLYASLPTGGALVSLSSSALSAPGQWPVIYVLGGLVPLLAIPGLILTVRDSRPKARETVRLTGVGEALFDSGRAARTIALWVGFFFALIAMYILLGWLPSLLVGRGLPRPEASLVQVGFNIFGALGSVLTGLLMDRRGGTLSVGGIFLAAILALAALAVAPVSLAISFVMGSLVGATVSGTQTILYALAPSCYPQQVRGTGVGFAVAVGRMGSAIGPLLAGAMLGGGASPARVLGALVPIMIVAGLAAAFVSARAERTDR